MILENKFFKDPTVLFALLLSICSIGYELLISKTVVAIGGEQILLQCLTIGFYIAGLGTGSFIAYRYAHKLNAQQFITTEMLLSMVGGLSPAILFMLFTQLRLHFSSEISTPFYLWESSSQKFIIYFTIISQIICFLIGTLSGIEIPYLLKSQTTDSTKISKTLSANYIGALIGTLLIEYYLLTRFELINIGLILSGINLTVCFFILVKNNLLHNFKNFSLAAITVLTLAMSVFIQDSILQKYLFVRYYGPIGLDKNPNRKIEHYQSAYQTFDLVYYPTNNPNEINSNQTTYYLFLNSYFQFSSASEREYHEYIVHIPIQLFNKVPKNILVLGGGDGLLIREILKHSNNITKIDHVELDPYIVELAKKHPVFTALNLNSLNSKLVHTIYDDAFTFLKKNRQLYDAIYIDFPYPTSYDLSKLYSYEFYTYLYKSLSDDGFSVVDHPLTSKNNINGFKYNQTLNNVGINTISKAGFKQIIPYFSLGNFSETFIAFRKNKSNLNWNSYVLGEIDIKTFNQQSLQKLKLLDESELNIDPHTNINSIFKPQIYKVSNFLAD